MNVEHYFSSELLKQYSIIKIGYSEELQPRSYQKYLDWLKQGLQGKLKYLEGDKSILRQNLKNYYPNCESAIVFLFDYRFARKQLKEDFPDAKIAAYTMISNGEDYHHSLKIALTQLGNELVKSNPSLEFKISLDTQPILERDLALRAGLGWIGKNSMLILPEFGSYFLIGSLLLNQKLEFEKAQISTDHCGTCRECLDACPTDAIREQDRTLNTQKCISTFTIETFKPTPFPEGMEQASGEVFGCDICQDVCPWNKKALEKMVSQKKLDNKLISFFNRKSSAIFSELSSMSLSQFRKFFANSSFLRTGKAGLLKNFINGESAQDYRNPKD
jgi:epoxyqueuosine reductase